jgi:hyperosmotically inducible protein
MTKLLTTVTIVFAVLATTAGCRTVTGQSLGTTVDDATTTAAVKAQLTAERLHNLTWVGVDTEDAVVYLEGTAATQAQKEAAGRIAASVTGVQKVVNNIHVRTADPGPAPIVRGATGSGSGSTDPQPAAASPATGSLTGRHTMTGEVEEIDVSSGFITVQTAEREMELHFPPQALQGINKGDRVTVELGIRPVR